MGDVGVSVDVNDTPTLEVAEGASPGDLQNIGSTRNRPPPKTAKWLPA
jgi:hypothetical protein